MRISDLDGRQVAIWGWGREGQAAHAAVRRRLPNQPLTLLCRPEEVAAACAVGDPLLVIETAIDGDRLAGFDVVIKSPGISPYHEPADTALRRGACLIGGTGLWFAENPEARTLCVTGTKGKSTATALIAHLLRAAGLRTALAGNIGLPLLELLDVEPPPQAWAIELSSFQTCEARAPEVAVVLNLFPEHLDWHGSVQRYYADKLALIERARPRIAVLPADPSMAVQVPAGVEPRWFGTGDGWHMSGQHLHRGRQRVADLAGLALPGGHNRSNVCAALTAVEAFGLDARALVPSLFDFRALPHRLQTLGTCGGIVCINDSIATTPHASIAALDTLAGQPLAVIVGGFDRGVDWTPFLTRIEQAPPLAVITHGQNGPRIHALLDSAARAGRFRLIAAEDLVAAVAAGRSVLAGAGVLLLSPGAPSFPRYRDYVERGRHFAALCGFDPDAITAIPGLGIA